MENEYGMSPFSMLQFIGPMMVVVPILMWVGVIGPLLVYPLARWKTARTGTHDPQLGLKVALHYFRMLAFQVLLLGALIVVWAVISKQDSDDKGEMYRMGFAFLLSSGIVFGVHTFLTTRTNDEQLPFVRRLFLGYNLVITGLLGFIAVVAAFQAIFAKGSTGDTGRLCFAALLVYGGAWAACGFNFARTVFGDSGSAPPYTTDVVVPPAAGQPGVPAPGLPSLSAGAYPPIDSK